MFKFIKYIYMNIHFYSSSNILFPSSTINIEKLTIQNALCFHWLHRSAKITKSAGFYCNPIECISSVLVIPCRWDFCIELMTNLNCLLNWAIRRNVRSVVASAATARASLTLWAITDNYRVLCRETTNDTHTHL